jgi:broad specificity phosphatase PhoE
MRELLLIRHGAVDADFETSLRAGELPAWIDAYNRAPLKEESHPPEELKERVERCGYLLASSLPRTLESARRLGREPGSREALFDEAEVARMPVLWLRMRPWNWLILARVLMTLGYRDRRGVSLRGARERAKRGAERLEWLAEEHGSVVLLGHGGMVWLTAKELRKRGWEEREASSENWGVTRLVNCS